jgi:hypothetical protein
MEALDRLGTLSAGPRWLPGISLNLGLVLLVCCCMHSNFAVMASWHGMICVSSTTVWSQRGKLGYLAIFALPHFLPHTKFYYILPHSTTIYHILPHLTTSYHILPHSTTFYHIYQNLTTRGHDLRHLRHDYCYVFNRLLQKRQRLHSNFECGYAFRLSRSDPQIMIRLYSVPQGRHCGDMW